MGLSGIKKRRKLAKDPNNTRWSRDENGFGHRILRSQGWQAGQYLGAKDAPYTSLYTTANASHIRVFLREDNSGIGHKRDVQDECTGLDAFQDILGRLNGKIEDQVEKEKKARGDYKRSLYTERKYGGVSFVRGGFLVGDETESVKDESENGDLTPDVCMNTEPQATLTAECETGPTKTPRRDKKERKERKDKKEKKRKASDHYPNSDRISRNKKRWKSEDGSRESTDFKASSLSSGDQSLTSSSRKIFKEKKFKSEPTFGDKGKQDKSKKDKRSKKWNDKSTNKAEDSEGLSSASGSREILMSPPPSVLGMTSHPPVDARRLHRSRFIAQKRAAVMDNAALNQIFMIKSVTGA